MLGQLRTRLCLRLTLYYPHLFLISFSTDLCLCLLSLQTRLFDEVSSKTEEMVWQVFARVTQSLSVTK